MGSLLLRHTSRYSRYASEGGYGLEYIQSAFIKNRFAHVCPSAKAHRITIYGRASICTMRDNVCSIRNRIARMYTVVHIELAPMRIRQNSGQLVDIGYFWNLYGAKVNCQFRPS